MSGYRLRCRDCGFRHVMTNGDIDPAVQHYDDTGHVILGDNGVPQDMARLSERLAEARRLKLVNRAAIEQSRTWVEQRHGKKGAA